MTTPRPAAPLPRQLLAVLIASAAAISANVVLYYLLKDFGVPFVAPEQLPSPELSPLPVSDVILFSLIFSAGAGLVFLVVANKARQPARVFAAISLVVLVLSCFLPLRIPTPPVPMATKYALISMHVLGALVLVPLLIRLGLPAKIHPPP